MSTSIAELLSSYQLEQSVTINGWVKTRRDSKAGVSFIQLSDGSTQHNLQIVITHYDDLKTITTGAAIQVHGTLVASKGREQAVEVQATRIDLLGGVDDPASYPIQPKRHSVEFLREVAHLRPRTNLMGAIARVRHTMAMAIHQYLNQQGFYWVHTPIITTSDCEGAGELFRVSTLDLQNLPRQANQCIDFREDFFGQEAYLTVSGQLNAEAYCMALSKVYTFGPTFRAENSNTSRHLAEFWMIEPEIAFADLYDNIELAESLLKHVITELLAQRPDEMAFFQQRIDPQCIERLNTLTKQSLETITYSEAIDLLLKSKHTFEFPVQWGTDLQSEHERYLAEQIFKAPLAIVNYPKEIKAFYMRLNDDERTVAAMDIVVPGMGEIIGGSQREERLAVLDQRLKDMDIDPTHLAWYRDLRRYGTAPHAGFGLGFERLISYATGVSNVKDVIPFPRTPSHATF